MRKIINILILFLFIGIASLYSCKSPMDINSPTDEEPIAYRIVPNLLVNNFDENGELINFTVNKASAEIDTLGNIPYVWMDLTFEKTQNSINNRDSLCISLFTIVIDSLPIIPLTEDTLDNHVNGSWTSFVIANNSGTSSDTLNSGMERNVTRVSFNFEKSRKELIAYIYTRLIKKQSSDTSFFRATLKFQY